MSLDVTWKLETLFKLSSVLKALDSDRIASNDFSELLNNIEHTSPSADDRRLIELLIDRTRCYLLMTVVYP